MEQELVYLPALDFVRGELIVNCIVAVFVLVVVGLRIVGRRLGPGLGWDDALVIGATPLALGILVAHGLIYANFEYISKITFGTQLVYVVSLSMIKASMLSFFLRVFVTTFLHNAALLMMVFVGLWMISYSCACVFLCRPISAQWTAMGTCGAYVPMIQSLIITNIISDLIIMSLPMYSIWSLQTRKTEKLGIMSCFALGLAVVVAATCRVVYLSTVLKNDNITATLATIMFLLTLEPNLAILCVSIPMLRPLYSMHRKRLGGARLRESDEERKGSKYAKSKSRSGGRSQKGTALSSRNQVEANATWEMEDFYRPDVVAHDTTVTGPEEDPATTPGDKSGSEENLTNPTDPQNAKGHIRVDTVWTMTRS